MTHCKKYKQWMIEARFGELDVTKKDKLDAHLETCADCQTKAETLKDTMKRMDQYERPEMDEAYWTAYWNKLESKLPAQKSPLGKSIRDALIRLLIPSTRSDWTPRLAFGAVIILIMGIYIGRTFFTNSQVIVQPVVGKKSLDLFMQTSQYVERSQLILLGIVNAESDDLFIDNFSRQQSMSRQLVNQSSELKTALADNKQYMLQELIEDLEVILLQIANLEVDSDIEAVDLIRSSAESSAILMKINLGELLLSRPQQESETDKKTQSI